MTGDRRNSGVINYGSGMTVRESVIGDGAIGHYASSAGSLAGEAQDRWDIGIITILSVEARAVQQVLGLTHTRNGDPQFEMGRLDVGGRSARVVATRTLDQGQRSTVVAIGELRRHYDPRVVLLVGIGGGIHPDLSLGDVVVATKVVYYDLRKETPSRTRRRGEGREAPAKIGHAVNRFFTEHGHAAEITPDDGAPFRVLTGPIGSGEAVVADRDAEVRHYLTSFNDKILAVDMESGGLTQFCHEHAGHPEGWVVVRGISDNASSEKNDEHHHRAARHAAIVLSELIPYLLIDL